MNSHPARVLPVAVDARLSTAEENPEAQLLPLGEIVAAPGGEVHGEYADLAHCCRWRQLLEHGGRRKFDLLVDAGNGVSVSGAA